MEKVNIDPDEIVELTKRLIEIHRKWIIEGVGDAEDMKNEDAGLSEQQVAIDEFAAQRGLSDSVRSKLCTAIRQFLDGGPTGDGDGPLVEDVSEDFYRAFAVRLSNAIAAGLDLREVFASFLYITRELYTALHRLGVDAELVSIVGRWRTPSDTDVLMILREYNATARVLHGPERLPGRILDLALPGRTGSVPGEDDTDKKPSQNEAPSVQGRSSCRRTTQPRWCSPREARPSAPWCS